MNRLAACTLAALLAALATLLVLLPATAEAGRYNPKMHKPEWRYIDEADDEEAEKMLTKLLRTHNSERKALRLVAKLRKGRPYASGLPRRETVEHLCADGKSRQFTYFIPARYSPKKPCGLLVFLHGAVRQPPPGGGHHEADRIGGAVNSLNFIKIGPSTYEGHEWGEAAVRASVGHALDFVKQRYNVDENRVFLAGDSDGGRGTYTLIETEATFYAAAIPVIGSPGGVTRFVNLRNLPWLAINGDKDTIFKVDGVRSSVESMKKFGMDLTWKLIEGGGHDPFFFVKHKGEVCEFIEKHPRVALPLEVDWQVDDTKSGYEAGSPANTFRWIRIDECGNTTSRGAFEDQGGLVRPAFGRVRAKKGDGNRVEVNTHRVKRFTILVSDKMFDLDEEIEIEVNGKPHFRGKIPTDARAALEEARRLNDRHLVFNNRLTIEVDRPSAGARDD